MELDEMKELYKTGDWIAIHKHFGKWEVDDYPNILINDNPEYITIGWGEYKLIHKKDKDVLEIYLTDNNTRDISWKVSEEADLWHCRDFIEEYNSDYIYRLSPKQTVTDLICEQETFTKKEVEDMLNSLNEFYLNRQEDKGKIENIFTLNEILQDIQDKKISVHVGELLIKAQFKIEEGK